jgi:formate-nitrite transporter family protein
MPFRARKREPGTSAAGDSPIQKNLARPSAEEIFKQVATNARQELDRPSIALALSGFGAGVFMGLSALSVALAIRLLGASTSAQMISRMFYPIGFIVVILGRSQLFTENTLYPVALVLAEKSQFWNTMRLWSVVLPANMLGAFAFGCLATRTSGIEPATVTAISRLVAATLDHSCAHLFWSGVVGGWLIALAAWLVSGSHSITGSVMVIWMLTFIMGLGNFAHCVASSCEIFVTLLAHQAPWIEFPRWFFPAVAGNICGGVGLVTILEYGQVMHGKVVEDVAREARRTDPARYGS